MKITEVVCQILRIPNVQAKTASSQDSVLVRVRTDTGLEGIGEADSSPEVVKAIIDAPFSHNIACGLRQLLDRREPARTRAALAEDVPPDDVLRPHGGRHHRDGGGRHGPVGPEGQGTSASRSTGCSAASSTTASAAYASILFGRDGEGDARTSPSGGARPGYTAVKFGWEPMGQSEAVDIDLVRGAREGAGRRRHAADRRRLRVGRPHGAAAGARLRRVPHRLARGAAARRTTSTATSGCATARRCRSRPARGSAAGSRSARSSTGRCLDVYQVDISRSGFTDAAYIRQRVEEIGARLCNHCYTSPVTVAASLHWLSTCRDAFLFEDCVEDSPLRHELTRREGAGGGRLDRGARPPRPGRDAGRGLRPAAPDRAVRVSRASAAAVGGVSVARIRVVSG